MESNNPPSPSNLKSEFKADSFEVDLSDPFDEFRNLCLLLTLTTAINLNDPHSHSKLSIPSSPVKESRGINDEHGEEHGMVPGGKVKVTAVAKPDVKDEAISFHYCEAVGPGINRWPVILESDHGWDYLGK
jgi:hypothetical protein